MPYASLDNKTNHVTYQVLGSQNYDYPCMDWYLIPKMQKQAFIIVEQCHDSSKDDQRE